MLSIFHDFLLIFLPLLVVLDPAGTVPVFLALTSHFTESQRRQIAIRATCVAAITGIAFIIVGQALLRFLGVEFADFQIAGGILLVILAVIDLLIPGKPAVDTTDPDPQHSIGVVPLAVPLIMGPATMTTALLLVNTYGGVYNSRFGAPVGQIIVVSMVCAATLLNLLLLFWAMWFATAIVRVVGRNTMSVINKIVMLLIAAIAVSLIRRGIVSIVTSLPRVH